MAAVAYGGLAIGLIKASTRVTTDAIAMVKSERLRPLLIRRVREGLRGTRTYAGVGVTHALIELVNVVSNGSKTIPCDWAEKRDSDYICQLCGEIGWH